MADKATGLLRALQDASRPMTEIEMIRAQIDVMKRRALTRACHDTMRELAAVAGLACWIDQAEFVEENTGVDPRCVVAIERKTLRYYARRLGWEAPDA